MQPVQLSIDYIEIVRINNNKICDAVLISGIQGNMECPKIVNVLRIPLLPRWLYLASIVQITPHWNHTWLSGFLEGGMFDQINNCLFSSNKFVC